MKRVFRITMVLAIAAGLLAFLAAPVAPSTEGAMETYIVLYGKQAVQDGAAQDVAKAGGELAYSYDQIGVVIARSDNAGFRDNMLGRKGVEGVASTANFGVKLDYEIEALDSVSNLSDWGDDLSYLQWDMVQIHVPEAQTITGGNPAVVVGDIDTGIDLTHPDLIPNLDFSKSVSCVGGVPNQDPAAWADSYGHGTHTAGTIAAAANGTGIVGVAPEVTLAAIKGCGDDGYCWPESIVCSFMWAADHQMDVTNNSYYVDPNEFNCRNDPEQRAVWKAVQRAVRYAQSRGVTVVSSAGNSNVDLTHHEDEEITNACLDLPVELSGVIGVSANGFLLQKSYYSSYGVGAVDVVAPGGDGRYQVPPVPISNGRVLSTWRGGGYVWAQGTSMASPHAAGVAALIVSQNGKMPPGSVQAMLTQTADPVPCPPNPFDPGGSGRYLATCLGGKGYNSFYGHGQINAYSAVTYAPRR